MTTTQELLREQGGNICAQIGHKFMIVMPVQINEETRQIFCGCQTCEEREWVQLSEINFSRFLRNLKAGKIK